MAAPELTTTEVKAPEMSLRLDTLLDMKRTKKVMGHEIVPLIEEILRWREQWNSGELVRLKGDILMGVEGDFHIERVPMTAVRGEYISLDSSTLRKLTPGSWTMMKWDSLYLLIKRVK